MDRLGDIKRQAHKEMAEEDFAEEVKAMKIKLRERKWWHRLFPFVIRFHRRKEV